MVLEVSAATVQRLAHSQGRVLEVKRHEGRGHGHSQRIRIPRASVVRYLVRISSGDKSVILAAIKEQCPQYLPAVADMVPGAAAVTMPTNVISMTEKRGRGDQEKRGAKQPKPEHPGQLFLFSA